MILAYQLMGLILIISSCTGSDFKPEFKEEYPILAPSSYVILESRGHGMFSILDDVLSLCLAYEKGDISGFEVNFGTTGLYYDPEKGPNWFTYYFKPLQVGRNLGQVFKTAVLPYKHYKKVQELGIYAITSIEFSNLERALTNKLIQKYLKLKPELKAEIDKYVKDNFYSDFMIGIHYRGTDKSNEAPRTSYEKVTEAINDTSKYRDIKNSKIFVATDESDFITYITGEFPNVCYQDAMRSTSGKAVHFENKDPYKTGKEAIMDAILLSKTDYLIRTSSNLSRWSTYFNPDVKVFELSKRF